MTDLSATGGWLTLRSSGAALRALLCRDRRASCGAAAHRHHLLQRRIWSHTRHVPGERPD